MSNESGRPDDHRCRSGRWCVARSGTSAAATVKPDWLCQNCIDAIQASRDKLPMLADAVQIFVGIKPVTAQSSKVSATKEPASPLNLSAETLLSDIGEVLSRVGNYLVRDLVRQPARKFKVWRGDVEQYTFFDGVDLALQVGAVCRRAVGLLGFEPVWQRRQALCRECGMPCLGQLSGSEIVQCSSCGWSVTDAGYQEYCVELVRGKSL